MNNKMNKILWNNPDPVGIKNQVKNLLTEADKHYQRSGEREEQKKAFDIYMALYESGVIDSLMFQRLGHLYSRGSIVTKDIVRGKEFYERAANLGNATSNAVLGYMYEEGKDIDRNISKAIYYYEKGGMCGSPECFFRIGELYHEGEKISQNFGMAIRYHKQALKQGYVNSYMALAMINKDIAKRKGKYGRRYYEKKAFVYAQKGYMAGAACAAGYLGWAYAFEIGVKHNYELAIKYDKEAILEYERLNRPKSDIEEMKKIVKQLEAENMREKAILYRT